jgi:peptide deformylase
MSKILQISEIGSSILRDSLSAGADAPRTETLRERSNLIPDPHQLDIKELIADLIATAEAANGVGIAAPQVASSVRLFIIASRPSPRYPYAPKMEPTAIIDPQIVDRSAEMVMGWEGCLSVPGVRGLVPRHQSIEVTYITAAGEFVRAELTDFIARIFQHELDHLDGILFPDRIASALPNRVLKPTDLITEAEYLKIAFD